MVRHAGYITVLGSIFLVLTIYPFLPGSHDVAATSLATTVQVFGVAGMLLVPINLAWLHHEARSTQKPHRRLYACATLVAGTLVTITVALAEAATSGLFLASLVSVLWLHCARMLIRRTNESDTHPPFDAMPLYLIALPSFVLIAQLCLAGPVTAWSRSRAIASSDSFIRDIDAYHTQFGHYPTSLLAQWKDYYPGIVGIEKYHYQAFGDSYNVFFEQPRFLLDDIGTREWVVYNPVDKHVMFSHTAILLKLSPDEAQRRAQGWYASYPAGPPHWKLFLFD